ncbi:MAG: methyltransferase domain-containing protein [Gemmatimonadetes bacterium]|nr:methyltransferase domain-containing protein [Gemmatimonadota bacterium]
MNAKFLNPDMDVQAWADRWEGESREVFRERLAIVEALAIEPGMRVADVGAGTGLFTGLFARSVGEEGHVYAVDISPGFITHIRDKADSLGLENVTAVLSRFTSATLAPASVDLVFLCDTYHHFDDHAAMLASIHSALDTGGRLAVIDFKRIEGESREWIMEHTRAGQETFVSEIEAAGFAFTGEVAMPGFEENYFVQFEKR